MPFGLTLSILLHGGALLWAYLAMAATPPLAPPEPEPVTVALITPSEFLALKKGSETAKELEAKAKDEPKPEVSKLEAEKPKPVTAPELPVEPEPAPTPPEPPKAAETPPEPPKQEPPKQEPPKSDPIADKLAALPPDPPPGPTPDELKKVEEEKKAEEQRQAEEKRKVEEEKKKAEDEKKKVEAEKKKAEEKKKADEKKKKLEEEKKKKLAEQKRKEDEKKKKQQQADRLAALLDKDPTRKGAPNSATQPQNPTDYTGPTAGAREGDAPVLSVREQDILKGQISAQLRQCWKLPGGGGGIETMVVTIRWRLRPDGTLEGEPAVEAPQSGPVFQIAAEAAVRAVKMCSPFNLPQDKYWAWKSIIWDFDPREML